MGSYRAWVRGIDAAPIPAAWSNAIDFFALPALLTPAAMTTQTAPTFSWTSVGGAASYNLCLTRTDVITRGIVDVSGITGTSYTTDALPIGSYRARVRAVSATGETSAWNVPYEFTTTVETLEFSCDTRRIAADAMGSAG